MVIQWAHWDRKAADALEKVPLTTMPVYSSTEPKAEVDSRMSNQMCISKYLLEWDISGKCLHQVAGHDMETSRQFIKYLLSTHGVPDTPLGARDTELAKTCLVKMNYD